MSEKLFRLYGGPYHGDIRAFDSLQNNTFFVQGVVTPKHISPNEVISVRTGMYETLGLTGVLVWTGWQDDKEPAQSFKKMKYYITDADMVNVLWGFQQAYELVYDHFISLPWNTVFSPNEVLVPEGIKLESHYDYRTNQQVFTLTVLTTKNERHSK